MTTVTTNTIEQVDTSSIIEFSIHTEHGIATFCGVLGKEDRELFYPFFCKEAAIEYVFTPDACLEFDSEYSYEFIERQTKEQLRETFNYLQTKQANLVANHEIFEAMTK